MTMKRIAASQTTPDQTEKIKDAFAFLEESLGHECAGQGCEICAARVKAQAKVLGLMLDVRRLLKSLFVMPVIPAVTCPGGVKSDPYALAFVRMND